MCKIPKVFFVFLFFSEEPIKSVALTESEDISTKEKVREVFLSCENDARALCFAWGLSHARKAGEPLLCRAAEMGSAFACNNNKVLERPSVAI